MSDAAVSFLLEQVSQLLISHVNLITGAVKELDALKRELASLKAFIKDSAKKPKQEERFRELVRQIRDVVYAAEDTIDSCLTQEAARPRSRILSKIIDPTSVSLAKQVKSLREEKVKPMFEEATLKFATMQITDGSGTAVKQSSRIVKQFIREDKVVGFEDEEMTLTGYLMEGTSKLDVISIIGMPGLGKTTLAYKIFQHPNTRFAFPTRIWAYVSEQLNLRELCLRILKEFTTQDMTGLSDEQLQPTVRSYLQSGRFLLVLDDIWTVEDWDSIQKLLPSSNMSGKVMITSRYKTVGDHANRNRDPHELRFLTDLESWDLLQLEVFDNLYDCPDELKDTGTEIATRCKGLPLALVIIGGILVDRSPKTQPTSTTKNAWKEISQNVSELIKNYDDDEKKAQGIKEIVGMSYNNLPDDLRECFLYLGMFPEDYEIPAWTLTHLWIAEGFIHKEGQSPEKTAQENLNDLISRNLVMVGKTNPEGEVKTCRVHDVIRQFCIDESKFEKQNFFEEVKMSKEGVFDPLVQDIHKHRRLCVHSRLSELLSKKPKGPSVRSFLCFYKDPMDLDPAYISSIPDAFSLLRVLDSKSFKFNQFPRKITKLIHLRYITLSCESLDILPEAVSELWNLQTLFVDTKSKALKIKANIWKLIQLRHLKTKAAILLAAKDQDGTGGENLQTLSRLSPDYCTPEVFKRARNIKKLGICGRLATLLDTNCSLQTLNHLESLKLVNKLLFESASGNQLIDLPSRKFFPVSIKRLTLSDTFLKWSQISTLAEIQSLQVLKLKDKAFVGDEWNAVGEGFVGLQFLLISGTDLIFWKASTGHFPCLQTLVLKNCEKLKDIPEGLAKTLQKLDMECVGQHAAKSAMKIEDERKKMKEGQPQAKWGRFKLTIGPGCDK